ncbi:MAG TPA: hypothetical protein VF163_06685, partial [Micromonosporaceae bacterium]
MTLYAGPTARPRRRPGGGAPPHRPRARRYDPEPPAPPPPKRRDPLWAKLCLILGSIVMVISGATVIVPRALAAWATQDISKEDLIPEQLRGEN